jgi:hypothetical protein
LILVFMRWLAMAAVAAEVVVGEVVEDAAAAEAVVVVAVGNLHLVVVGMMANIFQTGLVAIPHRFATAAGECVETRPSFAVRRRPFTQKQQRPHSNGLGALT